MSEPPDPVRCGALDRYGAAVRGLRWLPVGGGFSGARVWRGEDGDGPALALKAWPPDGITPERLAAVHRLMARAVHLPFVPVVIPSADGATAVVAGGRVWGLTQWRPGSADFAANPSPARLANACAALAELHRTWRPSRPVAAPCPAVRRRLQALADWRTLATSRPGPVAHDHPELAEALRRGWEAVALAADRAERLLRGLDALPVLLQPCMCDVWGAHVLFTGDAVTGVIDYGAVKDDHVSVDLARLLGDLVADDDARFAAGLDAYRAAGGVLGVPDEFVRVLDRVGVVCGVVTWLLRLCGGADPHPDPPTVAARLDRLAARVERNFP